MPDYAILVGPSACQPVVLVGTLLVTLLVLVAGIGLSVLADAWIRRGSARAPTGPARRRWDGRHGRSSCDRLGGRCDSSASC